MEFPSRRQLLRGSLALAGLGLLAGCGTVGLPAQQPARVPRIGWLHVTSGRGPTSDAFLEGLRELGYVDGQTIAIESRSLENQFERLPQIMAEFVSLGVDVIVAGGNVPIRAAKAATSTTPIVMLVSSDPVGDGHVASLAHPGGNVTGMSSIAVATVGKRLELLREILPPLRRLSVFWNTTEGAKAREFSELRDQAQSVGVDVHSAGVTSEADFDDSLAAATTARADALLALADPLTSSHAARIADFAVRNRLPSMYEGQEFVLAGGLACYGRNLPDLARRAATFVDKILKGAKPADLPVEQPTTFDFVINLRTAQALGLTIPQSLLAQATEIMQ